MALSTERGERRSTVARRVRDVGKRSNDVAAGDNLSGSGSRHDGPEILCKTT